MATSPSVLTEPRTSHHAQRAPTGTGQVTTLARFLRDKEGVPELDWASLDRDYAHLQTRFEPDLGILWCYQRHGERPCFAPGLLAEVLDLQSRLQDAFVDRPRAELALRYLVWASSTPGIYNLGGDLCLFTQYIRAGDRASLHRYAKACIDICYLNSVSLELPILTVALVQGDALGGGFEAVLSNDLIIAEAGSQFGLPEILFNMFPGMGAYSFLARRLDGARARQLILSGKLYAAEELAELGVVDLVVPVGEGETALRAHLERHAQRHGVLAALARVGRRCHPVSYDELLDIADIWVATALGLSETDLRRMERLATAQQRRQARVRCA